MVCVLLFYQIFCRIIIVLILFEEYMLSYNLNSPANSDMSVACM